MEIVLYCHMKFNLVVMNGIMDCGDECWRIENFQMKLWQESFWKRQEWYEILRFGNPYQKHDM
jgi:hypothetical protein